MSASRPAPGFRVRTAAAIGALILGWIALPGAAAAQGFGNFQGAPTGPVVGNADEKGGTKQSAPPALPGTRVQKSEAAPAQPGAADLPPTEALFDSINRGDMITARDAVNRGADLNGRNVLGMTPLDLSIDLGRNDITFLLLSLRPANPRDAAPASTTASGGRPDRTRGGKSAAAAPGKASQDASQAAANDGGTAPAVRPSARPDRKSRLAAQTPAKPGTSAAQPAPAAPAPRQYAGQREDPGTPNPQIGFLGFGGVTR